MNTISFVKSFSKGQITIPKKLRKAVGLRDDFWLKLSIEEGKIIAEPVGEEKNASGYSQKLLKVKGDWFSQDELEVNRQEIEKKLKDIHGQNSS